MFRKAAWDAGLKIPDKLPHVRNPVEFDEDPPRMPPPHPDDSTKRNETEGEKGSSGGGLPPTEEGSAGNSRQAEGEKGSGGGGLLPEEERSAGSSGQAEGENGSGGGGQPLTDVVEVDFSGLVIR